MKSSMFELGLSDDRVTVNQIAFSAIGKIQENSRKRNSSKLKPIFTIFTLNPTIIKCYTRIFNVCGNLTYVEIEVQIPRDKFRVNSQQIASI